MNKILTVNSSYCLYLSTSEVTTLQKEYYNNNQLLKSNAEINVLHYGMRKTITQLFLFILLAAFFIMIGSRIMAQDYQYIIVPHETSSCSDIPSSMGTISIPIWTKKKYTSSQMIYTAEELSNCGIVAGCKITKIAFYMITYNVSTTRNIVIYLDETTQTEFSSATDWQGYSTQVYDGTIGLSSSDWVIIDIDDYDYKGGNLVVSVDDNTNSAESQNNFWGFIDVTNTVLHRSSDDTDMSFTGTGALKNYRPVARFDYLPCPTWEYIIVIQTKPHFT